METTAVLITTAICMLVLFAVAILLIYFGYWMGRNSNEKPVRSIYNPKKTAHKAPIEDPAGDLFNDAAYGPPGATELTDDGIPTMGQR